MVRRLKTGSARRFCFSGWVAAAGILSAALVPVAASADVLEIDRHGAKWIAGGPSVPTPAPDVDTAAGAIPENLAAFGSTTLVSAEAGPPAWKSDVAAIAARYDISPTLLEALVWQESRWNPRAVSPAGARGLAQLMPGTARDLGVDPGDPRANLEGGARYLRMQLDAFGGDMERALAAYNAGPGRVQRARGIPKIRETQNYVTAILARLSDPVRK